jgi:hypothetical protein
VAESSHLSAKQLRKWPLGGQVLYSRIVEWIILMQDRREIFTSEKGKT